MLVENEYQFNFLKTFVKGDIVNSQVRNALTYPFYRVAVLLKNT